MLRGAIASRGFRVNMGTSFPGVPGTGSGTRLVVRESVCPEPGTYRGAGRVLRGLPDSMKNGRGGQGWFALYKGI